MKRILAAALLLFPLLSSAADPAFNDGANFGKGNAGQGTGSLQNPGVITGAIPGYTSTPPESGYYGGVTGGDGGIGGKGQTAIGNNQAGGAIIDSGNKNPPVKIDPNAPFITIGKDAEGGAEGVLNGTNQQCTAVNVSKSTFENYQCDKDVASVEACRRTATATGHYETTSGVKTFTINAPEMQTSFDGAKGFYFTFPAPVTGKIISASISYQNFSKGKIRYLDFWGLSGVYLKYSDPFSSNLPGASSYPLIEGQNVPAGHLTNNQCVGGRQGVCSDNARQDMVDMTNGNFVITVTITIDTTISKWVPDVTWSASCTFDKTKGVPTTSVCTSPGGYKTVVHDGQSYQVYSDCWEYTDNYLVVSDSPGNCSSLMTNANCTVSAQTCTDTTDGQCTHKSYTYQCQKTYQSGGLVCGGDYYCKSGDCDAANGAGDAGFDTAVAKLAGLASAGEDVRNGQNQMDVRAFTGTAMSCRKAFAGFNNCCKDSGWGQDTGLAACNSDEMAIGKAKAKKVTVSLGERCDHSVLGVCVQKSQVYCVFQGKLARIIQEQGRRDQLGVGFGSGDSPNCSGITVPQLQSINFDLINFSDFYEDLMANQKVPDSDAMVKQVKDRIAAQVNAQTGGK